jgi:hypothetical protein
MGISPSIAARLSRYRIVGFAKNGQVTLEG